MQFLPSLCYSYGKDQRALRNEVQKILREEGKVEQFTILEKQMCICVGRYFSRKIEHMLLPTFT